MPHTKMAEPPDYRSHANFTIARRRLDSFRLSQQPPVQRRSPSGSINKTVDFTGEASTSMEQHRSFSMSFRLEPLAIISSVRFSAANKDSACDAVLVAYRKRHTGRGKIPHSSPSFDWTGRLGTSSASWHSLSGNPTEWVWRRSEGWGAVTCFPPSFLHVVFLPRDRRIR